MPANAFAVVGQHAAVPLDPGIRDTRTSDTEVDLRAYTSSDERHDHFIERDGEIFAGTHLIIDFHGAEGLDDLARMEEGLRGAVAAAGATLLHIHLHHFTPNGGISGVAVLAESHISVHTWPERDYAAFDIFMCGDARPELGARVLQETFLPERTEIVEHRRGRVHDAR
jgi:S-adenosylmethionine decarboxylase